MNKRYILEGNPTPLARPRISGKRVYDSQQQFKMICALHLRNQHGTLPFYEGPLHLDIWFYMPIPKHLSLKLQEKLHGTPHAKKPDIDNMIKLVNDIGREILFKDDNCITSIHAYKLYDKNPRTEFTLKELE